MIIRAKVMEEMQRVAKEQEVDLPPLADSMLLLNTGLDSLAFAMIVARLEDVLGDPFTTNEEAPFPVTVGDFIGAYESMQATSS